MVCKTNEEGDGFTMSKNINFCRRLRSSVIDEKFDFMALVDEQVGGLDQLPGHAQTPINTFQP